MRIHMFSADERHIPEDMKQKLLLGQEGDARNKDILFCRIKYWFKIFLKVFAL